MALGRAGNVIDFNPALHPRDREGQFRKVLGGLSIGQQVKLPDGTTVEKRHLGQYEVKPGSVVGSGASGALKGKSSYHTVAGKGDAVDAVLATKDFEPGDRIEIPATAAHGGLYPEAATPARTGRITGGVRGLTGAALILPVRWDDGTTGTVQDWEIKRLNQRSDPWKRFADAPEERPGTSKKERKRIEKQSLADDETRARRVPPIGMGYAVEALVEVSSASLPDIPNKPGVSNWVEKAGGLPKYIERVAKHLQAKGRPTGVAIATAVNHAKKMCAGGTAFGGKVKVSEKARAVACKAVAEWEAKKAKSKVSEALELSEAEEREIIEIAEASYWEMKLEEAEEAVKLAEQKATGAVIATARARRDHFARKVLQEDADCPMPHSKMAGKGMKACPKCKMKLDKESKAEDAEEKVEEGLLGRGGKTIDFDPKLHPRDREGQFRKVLYDMPVGATVKLPSGVKVKKDKLGFEIKGKGGDRAWPYDPEAAAQKALTWDLASGDDFLNPRADNAGLDELFPGELDFTWHDKTASPARRKAAKARLKALAKGGDQVAKQALGLSEGLFGRGGGTIDFNPNLHPRDREGQFRKALGSLSKGQSLSVKMPDGSTVQVKRGQKRNALDGGPEFYIGSTGEGSNGARKDNAAAILTGIVAARRKRDK